MQGEGVSTKGIAVGHTDAIQVQVLRDGMTVHRYLMQTQSPQNAKMGMFLQESPGPQVNNPVTNWPDSVPTKDRNVEGRMSPQGRYQRCREGALDTSESACFQGDFQSFLNFDVAIWRSRAQHLLALRLKKANGGRLNG